MSFSETVCDFQRNELDELELWSGAKTEAMRRQRKSGDAQKRTSLGKFKLL